MSKLETNTIDTISGSTTLTLGGTNATDVTFGAGVKITNFVSTGIDDNATSTAITIDSSENVGIGTSSPDEKLTLSADGSTASQPVAISLNANRASGSGGATSIIESETDGASSESRLKFYTRPGSGSNPTERMRILNGGQVVLGGTSWVGGASTDSGLQIDMNTSTDATFGLIIRNGSNASSFIHKMNGSTFNTTGTFGSFSDERFKENIVDAKSKLEEVKQLKVRNFNLIGEQEKYLGFIAQEIEQVFPNIVDTQAERTHEEKDNDGNVTTVTTPETKLVKTTVLIPILTKALQEAITKIEELEARITALENA